MGQYTFSLQKLHFAVNSTLKSELDGWSDINGVGGKFSKTNHNKEDAWNKEGDG